MKNNFPTIELIKHFVWFHFVYVLCCSTVVHFSMFFIFFPRSLFCFLCSCALLGWWWAFILIQDNFRFEESIQKYEKHKNNVSFTCFAKSRAIIVSLMKSIYWTTQEDMNSASSQWKYCNIIISSMEQFEIVLRSLCSLHCIFSIYFLLLLPLYCYDKISLFLDSVCLFFYLFMFFLFLSKSHENCNVLFNWFSKMII